MTDSVTSSAFYYVNTYSTWNPGDCKPKEHSLLTYIESSLVGSVALL